jgi:transcriptional regulator with XRE-family HTH domain
MNDSERLRKLRINLGLTNLEFARLIGLTGDNAADNIRAFERGSKGISGPLAMLIRYIEKYGIIEKD